MRVKRFRLNRRTFLRGTAGAAVALPWLEVMEPVQRAHAQAGGPPAYIVALTGTSFMDNGFNGSPGSLVLPPSLQDLEPLRDYVSIVSDLSIPRGGSSGSPVAGGVQGGDLKHGALLVPLVTGHRHVGSRSGQPTPDGPSSDVYVASAIGQGAAIPSLHLRVQPENYGRASQGKMSIRADGDRNDPFSSPRAAYDAIFGGVQGGSTTGPTPSAVVDHGGSVLDLVLQRLNRLERELPAWDRARVQRHMEEIRAIERRMQAIPEAGGACSVPAAPGADPGRVSHTVGCADGSSGCSSGWSDETSRGDVLSSLLSVAIACDITRVATYMIGWLSSYLSMQSLFNVAFNTHDVTHGPFDSSVGRSRAQEVRRGMTRWYASRFTELVTKLHALPEGDGNVLDRTVAVLLWECGHSGYNAARAHMTNEYVLTIAGRPDVLRHGQHVAGNGRHPCQLLQTAMLSVGVDQAFGANPGVLSDLVR